MTSQLTLARLVKAVQEDAAIRRLRKLQPTGGQGDKVFPPTYPGAKKEDPPRHVFEHRQFKGDNVLCVLVDSVQSQANRLEEALRYAREDGKVFFPVIAVDFGNSDVRDIGRITTLDAPHRVYDAIIRDGELDGKPFRDTDFGKKLIEAKPQNAAGLYELSPTALVFGAWNSTGEGGGLGAKFPRAVVSEIIGVSVATDRAPTKEDPDALKPSGQRPGSRIDPLGIRSGVRVWKFPDGTWGFDAPAATAAGDESKPSKKTEAKTKERKGEEPKAGKKKEAKEVKPSEVNHSNIAPTLQALGVSVDHFLHTFVISFAALRRLRFPSTGKSSAERQTHAHASLAALALLSGLAQDRAGYFLRSRCDLVPAEGEPDNFEIVLSSGRREPFEVTLDDACALFKEAVTATAKSGLLWRDEDVILQPQQKLIELVLRSRQQALQGVPEAEES